MKRFFFSYFLLLLFFSLIAIPLFADVVYDVRIEGVNNRSTQEMLESVSQLFTLKDHPPPTKTALRRRAEADTPNLLKGLQSLGHYSPDINLDVDTDTVPAMITIHVDPGPIYPLVSIAVVPSEDDPGLFPYECITPKSLHLCIGEAALPKEIIDAELTLWHLMADHGFPLATVTKRTVVADVAATTISLTFEAWSGPKARFATPTITGCSRVDERLIQRKIAWCPGQLYDLSLVEKTQNELEATGLFSAVTITTADTLDEEGSVPIEIVLQESRHRTIGFGISYNTQLGPGLTAEWQNRNVRHIGETITAEGDLWVDRQRGSILFIQPDFLCRDQDLLWIAEAEREKTRGFTETFLSLSLLLDQTICENTKLSYGITLKQLDTDDSDNDGAYSLVKFPVQLRWSNANDLLDPSYGITLQTKFTPTVQMANPQFSYYINTFTGSAYYPLSCDHSFVLAGKATLGSIYGSARRTLPAPERFYSGSEHTLRGYRYKTVSPLSPTLKPLGGRSLMAYALELRARMTETIGWVLFYEIGNVYSTILPNFQQPQLESTGIGLRYYTPVGPLRVDLAIPLNRRPGLDKNFQLYFSIGQTF